MSSASATSNHLNAWTTLVSAEALAAVLGRGGRADQPVLDHPFVDRPVVIDARFTLADLDAGEAAWRAGHVPHARYAHLDRDLSDHRKAGAGRHPWPEAHDFTAVLGGWGVTPDRQVVIYDAADGALAAARVWFLLRALGHRRVAVLDGGWAAWIDSNFPVDTAVPTPSATGYAGQFDSSRLCDAGQVELHLQQCGILLDARAAERFRGDVEPIDRVAGHVPGAVNRAYTENLHEGRFKPAPLLHAEFTALLGGRTPDEVVAMCGSGVTACHHLLAMEHAGLHGAKLYTGSWSGWISDPSRPVARGSSRKALGE